MDDYKWLDSLGTVHEPIIMTRYTARTISDLTGLIEFIVNKKI